MLRSKPGLLDQQAPAGIQLIGVYRASRLPQLRTTGSHRELPDTSEMHPHLKLKWRRKPGSETTTALPSFYLGFTLFHLPRACATENIDHSFIEGRNVVRLTTGDEIAVHYSFLVNPFGSSILNVGLQRWP